MKKKRNMNMGRIFSRKIFIWTVVTLLVAVDSSPLPSTQCPVTTQLPADNYTNALHKALMFFDAQRSGKLPNCNNVSWRGDSCLQDGESAKKDLTGGYYDAGDAIKLNFPASFSMTLLSWSVLVYNQTYIDAGELDHVKDHIKWGIDYLLKTFNSSADTIDTVISQVGSGFGTGQNDRSCWMRPEDIDYDRPVTECHACIELATEMAAALASASLVFKDNKAYSQKLVKGAITLFDFAWKNLHNYSAISSDAVYSYNSTGYYDEIIWGAAWLYIATGEHTYLEIAIIPELARSAGASRDYFDVHRLPMFFSWDNKALGAQVLLVSTTLGLRFNGKAKFTLEPLIWNYFKEASLVLCSYLPDSRIYNRTKGGLILLNRTEVEPLQNAVYAAFIATVFTDSVETGRDLFCSVHSRYKSPNSLRDFAKTQIDYVLGNNPQNMSYVVGYGTNYPRHVHHRGASIPNDNVKYSCEGGWKWRDTENPDPNTITGAMVAGPDKYDGFQDIRTNYKYTRPTLAGNAGLVAALVSLSNPFDVS